MNPQGKERKIVSMAEPEEPEQQHQHQKFLHPHPRSMEILTSFQHQPPAERDNIMMDLDLDLDSSWTFDQIFSAAAAAATTTNNNSTSSFLLSTTSEQPCSPLWAFSDENNEDKPSGNSTTALGLRLSDYPRLVNCKLLSYRSCLTQTFRIYYYFLDEMDNPFKKVLFV